MKCRECGKPIKENTDGNKKYCQGHDFPGWSDEPMHNDREDFHSDGFDGFVRDEPYFPEI